MKKIILLTDNRILIEMTTAMVHMSSVLVCQLLATSRIETLVSDIEMFKANTVIIDGSCSWNKKMITELCKSVHAVAMVKESFLLIDGVDSGIQFASTLKEEKLIDDYIIYDESLKALFEKLKK